MFENILVTGGAGFIGSQLIKKLLPLCRHIYIIDDLSTGQKNAVPVSEKITFHHDCITNKKLLFEIMPKVKHIFHLACSNLLQSVRDLEKDFQTNLFGGFVMLQCAKSHCPDLKRFVYTSTASIYSDASILPTPETYYKISLPYAASKFSSEHYCDVYNHMYQLPTTVLRLSNVYGPGQTTSNPYCGVVAKFFEAAQKKQPLMVYMDGQQTRDFTYIEDALDALLLSAVKEKAIGQIYNVGMGVETNIIELAEKIKYITGFTKGTIEFRPKRQIDIVARRNIDAKKIQKELNWKPQYNLHEGLLKTFQWMKG
ncbi:GDP-mannose 4,6-dehydratase [Candidatus Contubernalis alkalaceticus]|nr:GDP-mannose 4,6-dehydratase [Candidatus Contubernalis alkalaceticus]